MRRRVAALAVLLVVMAPGGVALATTHRVATELRVSRETDTVSGEAVTIRAALRDADGRRVPGASIRLLTMVTFLGAEREQVLDESRTDEDGVATLVFAPTEPGRPRVTVRFAGAAGYGPSEVALRFNVLEAVVAYASEPAGIQVWWARSRLILLPFIVVWIAYIVALAQVVRVRRAGLRPGRI